MGSFLKAYILSIVVWKTQSTIKKKAIDCFSNLTVHLIYDKLKLHFKLRCAVLDGIFK